MPNVKCECVSFGAKDWENNVCFVFRVEGYKDYIFAKAYVGSQEGIFYTFILN